MALFDLLLAEMGAVESAAQLQSANAVAHGTAMAQNGKDAGVQEFTRSLIARAFPHVWEEEGAVNG